MENNELLTKIKDEYNLGYNYVQPLRQLYRGRILRWNPQNKKESKINTDMIADAIDVKIASSRTNGLKVKFVSSAGWIGEEEAENLTRVAEFDERESARQQVRYQLEQDSWFFGVGILNKVGWDNTKVCNIWRAVNPLCWIPDPLPTQTGQFDGQNYRFHGFMMRTNAYDLRDRFGISNVNDFFAKQFNSDNQLTVQAYSARGGYGPITCDKLTDNFSLDLYTHYTIINGRKHKVITDGQFSHIFEKEELKPVLKEEKIDPKLVPRPIMLNYTDPMRDSAFGNSLCDKLEDKQNAKDILFNLNVIKAKKEALGGDFLVNSRLIKNKEDLQKSTAETRYLFIDEDSLGDNPIQNAMFELPQSQIKSDTFAMINALDAEASKRAKIDNMQAGLVSDKTMTKAEAQTIQGNANAIVRTVDSIKQWFYKDMFFQRWRGYQEHMKAGQNKFAVLSSNFEWKGVTYTKDNFIGSQIPYIMVGSEDEINAINESRKAYINQMLPQIVADPSVPEVSKMIFRRLAHKINGIQQNMINIIAPYSPSEQKAKEYVDMVNMGVMPKSLFSNPDADFFTYYLYLQKAEEGEVKDKVLNTLNQYLLENGQKQQMQGNNQVSNSAANMMMAQNQQKERPVSRETALSNQGQ